MGSYNTSDFKRGLKVQIDGDPYLMVECNFVKLVPCTVFTIHILCNCSISAHHILKLSITPS